MSTSSTSAASGSSGSSLFTGSSQFASSLAQSVQRSVAIASLPLQQMQNDLGKLQSQSSQLSTFSSDFNNVQSAISNIQSALGLSSYTSSSSDNSVATVALSGSPSVSSVTVTVSDIGAYATAMSADSLPKVTDPATANISDATTYTLSIGTSGSYTIVPSSKTLSALADAINQSGQAQASIVNIGPPSSPDYRLYVQADELGDTPVQLTAQNGSSPNQTLLTAQTTGKPATYQVNGQPSTPISTTNRAITVEPGVTVTLQGEGTSTISVDRSTAAVGSALSQLANAYNAAVSDLNKNHGSSGGALTGQSIVLTLSTALRNLVGYSSGSSGISTLTDLGFSLDQNGVLSFDSSAFAQATGNNLTQLTDFLGSTDGSGFLKTANDALTSLDDPINGVITDSINTLSDEITQKNSDISDEQDKINTMQTNLENQMAAADASISSMEQQQIYLQGLFSAMQTQAQTIANG